MEYIYLIYQQQIPEVVQKVKIEEWESISSYVN